MKKYIYIFLALFFSLIFFRSANAEQLPYLFLEQSEPAITIGDEFLIKLFLNTNDNSVNAGQIKLLFSQDGLEVRQVNPSNSIFSLWAKEPNINNESGEINFTGGLPSPGFIGDRGLMLEALLKAKAVGDFQIKTNSSNILKNDGLGTKLRVLEANKTISVRKAIPGYVPSTVIKNLDTSPPVNVVLNVGRSDLIYDGKYFAAFTAEDKESRVVKYEIAEVLWDLHGENDIFPEETDWNEAKSPYVLKNQNKNETVFLRVTDSFGNKTVVSQKLEIAEKKTKNLIFKALILIAVLIIIIIISKLSKKSLHK